MLKNAVLVAVALAVSVVIGWAATRVFVPEMLFEAAPNNGPTDPVLGWVMPVRPDPTPGEPCASVFGDSFTYGWDVSDSEAWPALLSKSLGCRVENYGVPGYGTDQALLRFRQVERGKTVMLLHTAENVIRNVNQMRTLLAPFYIPGYKPRFLADGTLIPVSEAPAGRHETFWRLGPWRSPFLIWGHLIGRNERRPSFAIFYEGEPLDVTAWILRNFVREAQARGQTPIIGIIPTCRDLMLSISYGPLLDRLSGLPVFDFAPEILKRTRDIPSLFLKDCSGHPNAAGYRMMAEIAAEHLSRPSAASRGEAVKRP